MQIAFSMLTNMTYSGLLGHGYTVSGMQITVLVMPWVRCMPNNILTTKISERLQYDNTLQMLPSGHLVPK